MQRSFEILDLRIPYTWFNFPFLFPSPIFRPSSSLSLSLSPRNDRLSRTLVAIPRFHPRDNLSPRYTISLRIRAILLIFHHPSTSSTFHFPPFPLRISTLWNATNDVSRHRKFRVIYLHFGLHLERERERVSRSVWTQKWQWRGL